MRYHNSMCIAMLLGILLVAACAKLETFPLISSTPPPGYVHAGAAKTSWATGSSTGMANKTTVINEWDTFVAATNDGVIQELLIRQTMRLANSNWTMSPAQAKTYPWALSSKSITSENNNNREIAKLLASKGYTFDAPLSCGATFFKNTKKTNVFVHYCCADSQIPGEVQTEEAKTNYLTNIARQKLGE